MRDKIMNIANQRVSMVTPTPMDIDAVNQHVEDGVEPAGEDCKVAVVRDVVVRVRAHRHEDADGLESFHRTGHVVRVHVHPPVAHHHQLTGQSCVNAKHAQHPALWVEHDHCRVHDYQHRVVLCQVADRRHVKNTGW